MAELTKEEVGVEAIKRFGKIKQLLMTLEELSELSKAIVKFWRHDWNAVWRIKTLEEVADVEIQCYQIRHMLSTPEEYDRIMQQKLANLKAIIRNDDPLRGIKTKKQKVKI